MRRLIYLFDSESSISSLRLVSFFQDREPGIELIAIVDTGIADRSRLSALFDRHYVIPTTFDPLDPCPIALSDVVAAAQAEFIGCSDIRVIGYGEYTPLVAAGLREHFNLDGMRVQEALAFRDKLVMKSVVGNAVRVPKNMRFNRAKYADSPECYLHMLGQALGWPFIIKPVNAASALGTRIIRSALDANPAAAALAEFAGSFEAESYITGTLLHCEIVYRDKVPLVACCSRFNRPVLALAEGKCVGSIPLMPDDPLSVRAIEFCRLALAQTGIRDGITHTELFLDKNDQLMFLETAARCPGGRVIEAYMETMGVNLLDLDQRLKAGLPVSVRCEPSGRGAFWAVIPKKAGRLTGLRDAGFDGTCEVRPFFEVGDVMEGHSNFENIFGVVFVTAPSYQAAQRDFDNVANATFFDVEPA